MGYACPVCDAEQVDAVHLANHLAVTASLGREDHLEWLEEHAPDWADCGPEELGERVAPFAPEVETPAFEEGPMSESGHDHGHPHGHGTHGLEGPQPPSFEAELARRARRPGRGSLTSETERVLEEARELTRRMTSADEGEGAGERESDAEGADAEGADADEGGDGSTSGTDAEPETDAENENA
ncbi:DUF5810 domain-containing protein [Natrialbaceae archaeon GCM10025810]|uniref:DUF5810 domain-containing protein n=1 Tax=Halovalidus salilacus TaxID=3075124 RepID=UPI0036220727